MKTKLRFGIIGAGNFANLCHIPGLQSHSLAEVTALCGRHKDRVETLATKHNISMAYTDYRELLERSDIDAVTIVTPPASHKEISLAALAANKHVFCEKPLAMNGMEAQQMYETAIQSGKIHMVGFIFRYLKCIQTMKALIQDGDIGIPHYIRIRRETMNGLSPEYRATWRAVKALSGGHVVQEMVSHCLDLTEWILGDLIQSVNALMIDLRRTIPQVDTGQPVITENDDIDAVWLKTKQASGDIFWSYVTAPHDGPSGWIDVTGENGALRAALSRGEPDKLYRFDISGNCREIPLNPHQPGQHAMEDMMHSFVGAILNGAPKNGWNATFKEGWRVQKIIDAILASAAEGRWITID